MSTAQGRYYNHDYINIAKSVIFNAVLHHELLSPHYGKYARLNTQLIKTEHQALIDKTAWHLSIEERNQLWKDLLNMIKSAPGTIEALKDLAAGRREEITRLEVKCGNDYSRWRRFIADESNPTHGLAVWIRACDERARDICTEEEVLMQKALILKMLEKLQEAFEKGINIATAELYRF